MSFGASAKAPPPAPPPPAPAQAASSSVQNSGAQEIAALSGAEGMGYGGTIATSPEGAAAPTTAKQLLGY